MNLLKMCLQLVSSCNEPCGEFLRQARPAGEAQFEESFPVNFRIFDKRLAVKAGVVAIVAARNVIGFHKTWGCPEMVYPRLADSNGESDRT